MIKIIETPNQLPKQYTRNAVKKEWKKWLAGKLEAKVELCDHENLKEAVGGYKCLDCDLHFPSSSSHPLVQAKLIIEKK